MPFTKQSPSPIKKPGSPGKKLFFLIVGLELLLTIWLIINRRYGGHDTFQYFTIFYYFLNNASLCGEIPQWNPFIMHGIPASNWGYFEAGTGLLFHVLMLLGGMIRHLNFLPIYHLDIFLREFILLLGSWLLAKRYFSSAYTHFFVSVSILGSCVWYSQVFYNLFSFYFLIRFKKSYNVVEIGG